MKLSLALIAFSCLVGSHGCGSSNPSDGTGGNDSGSAESSGSAEGSSSTHGSADGTAGDVDRGPTRIDVDGDPNGLWWEASSHTLFLADDNNNRVLSWDDEVGFAAAAELPAAPDEGPGLGQIVRTADGTFVVTRFGGGFAGDVVTTTAGGTGEIVPDLDPERRRIGLTIADDGTLYDSWFVKMGEERVGSVGRLSLSGEEVEVIPGLVKPVGVLAIGDSLYVSDQDLGQLLRAPIADPAAYEVVATNLDTPDLIAAGPEGSVLTGSAAGELLRIDSAGAVTVVASGFQQVRGVAYDPEAGRAFIADHDADESDGTTHALQIVPIDP